MSGGSFNKLYNVRPAGLAARLGGVQRMAQRLREMGHTEPADATDALADHLRASFSMAPSRLREVWRAVERVDSGDWGPVRLAEAVAAYATASTRFGTLDGESFVACECDRTEDVRLDGGCIADGEVERLRSAGWFYDGVTWVCPEHSKNIIAHVPLNVGDNADVKTTPSGVRYVTENDVLNSESGQAIVGRTGEAWRRHG